jgi:hypothetical protein
MIRSAVFSGDIVPLRLKFVECATDSLLYDVVALYGGFDVISGVFSTPVKKSVAHPSFPPKGLSAAPLFYEMTPKLNASQITPYAASGVHKTSNRAGVHKTSNRAGVHNFQSCILNPKKNLKMFSRM